MNDYVKLLEDAIEKHEDKVSQLKKIIEAYNQVDFIFDVKFANKSDEIIGVKLLLSFKNCPNSIVIANFKKIKTSPKWTLSIDGSPTKDFVFSNKHECLFYIDIILESINISDIPYRII